MFDIGGWELLVVASLALIVVGPKELPRMVRTVGKWAHKARGMAREFQRGMEDAAKEADLEDLKKIGNVRKSIADEVRSVGADASRALNGQISKNASPPGKPVEKRQEPRLDSAPDRRSSSLPAEDDARLEQFERGVGGGRRD